MNMNKDILNKKIEETLTSIDGIKHAEANPLMYSKISDKINNKKSKENVSLIKNTYILKFAVILIAALLLNMFTYFSYTKYDETSNDNTNSREENLKSFAKEYSITGTTYNY